MTRLPGLYRASWYCVLLLLTACAGAPTDESSWQPPPLAPPPPGARAEAVEWARAHVIPLASLEPGSPRDDLRTLKAAIGDARIIGFGEGMHDTHEYLVLRNRLFEFLVTEAGVTAIGLETGATEALAADDYVLGAAAADAATYTGVFSWGDTPLLENKQLLDWMRAYNDLPTTRRKLRVFGLDLTGGRNGQFTQARLSLEAMLKFVDDVAPALAQRFHKVIDPLLPAFNTPGYEKLSVSERNALTATIAEAVGAFEREQVLWIERSSNFAYSRAYGQAVVARQLDTGLRNSMDVQSQRDASMAHNAARVLRELGPDGRLMVFAYAGHIRSGPAPEAPEALGVYLRQMFGSQYFAIGSTYNQGAVGIAGEDEWPLEPSQPATLNAALREGAGRDWFYIETRQFPVEGALADWIDRGEPLRGHHWEGRPRSSFDVLIHIDRLQPAHGLQRSGA